MEIDKLDSEDYLYEEEEQDEVQEDVEDEPVEQEETSNLPYDRDTELPRASIRLMNAAPTSDFYCKYKWECVENDSDSGDGDLVLQVIDIEQSMERINNEQYDDPQVVKRRYSDLMPNNPNRKRKYPTTMPRVPCVRLYCKTMGGRSVCVNCYGYYPVVHARCSNPHIDDLLKDSIENTLDSHLRPLGYGSNQRVIMCTRVVQGYPAYPFVPNAESFLEFKLANYSSISRFAKLLWTGGLNMPIDGYEDMTLEPYSCNGYISKFQADTGIKGFGWITIPYGYYTLVPDNSACFTDIEVDTTYSALRVDDSDDRIAPLRKLTFDIECIKNSGFPDAQVDPVVCISCSLEEHTNGQSTKVTNVLLTFPGGDRVDGVEEQVSFSTEEELIDGFGALVKTFDPDYLCGHNIVGFDIPYIVTRAQVLGIESSQWLGRHSAWRFTLPRVVIKKRKNGEKRETKVTLTPGRVQLDTMVYIQNGFVKERRYSLAYLSEKYLNASKDDVPPPMIWVLYHGSDTSRGKLWKYCMKDTVLARGLSNSKWYQMVIGSIELSRVTTIPANKALSSGLQAQVWGLLYLAAKQPHFDAEENPVFFPYLETAERGKDDKFQGATVLNPTRGFYRDWVLCGDYQSLYPSMIMTHNICYSTELKNPADWGRIPNECSPSGTHFVKGDVRKGLLPQLEVRLMAARANSKKHEAAAIDAALKCMFNARQNNEKKICNSVYGITTASGGYLSCLEIGESVTSWGRMMIDSAKRIAENDIIPMLGESKKNEKIKVIYGDTDSIFMLISRGLASDQAGAFELLKLICKTVTDRFAPSPVKLQAEKIMTNLIMINKKRYIAAKYEGTNDKPKLLVKGVETARRDNCLMVVKTMNALMKNIILDGLWKEKDKALAPLNDTINGLLRGTIPMSDLVISKAVTKDDYKIKPPHIAVVEKMRRIDPTYSGGGLSDRVPFVVCANGGVSVTQKAEDPLYAIMQQLPIDTNYYLDKQLAGPVSRIVMWLYGRKEDLTAIKSVEDSFDYGDVSASHKRVIKAMDAMQNHMKQELFGTQAMIRHPIRVRTCPSRTWGIDRFFTKVRKCVLCGGAINGKHKLCTSCYPPKVCEQCGTEHQGGTLCPECSYHCSVCGCLSTTETCDECAKEDGGLCGWCHTDPVASCGKCKRCAARAEILKRHNLSREECIDIEELMSRAIDAKLKCDECRGYSDEGGIACRQKDCDNLFLRAKLDIEIQNNKK